MLPNNAFERTMVHCGPHPFSQQQLACSVRQAASWPAAQLGRYTSHCASSMLGQTLQRFPVASRPVSSIAGSLDARSSGAVSCVGVEVMCTGAAFEHVGINPRAGALSVVASGTASEAARQFTQGAGVAHDCVTYNYAFETDAIAGSAALCQRAAQRGR
jgi:hypothetical protein